MHGFTAAAQQGGIARGKAQGGGIRRNIGATFIDDANHAQGYAHARNGHAIGADAFIDRRTHRVGQMSNRLHPGGHPVDPPGIQPKPIQHRARKARFRPCLHILLIGQQTFRRRRAQSMCRRN